MGTEEYPVNISNIHARSQGDINLMTKFKFLLASRKFWAALIGLCFVIIKAWKPDFPLAEEELTSVVYLMVAYILGTGIEDGLSRGALLK
jgi:hypothetical protein